MPDLINKREKIVGLLEDILENRNQFIQLLFKRVSSHIKPSDFCCSGVSFIGKHCRSDVPNPLKIS